MRLPARPAAPRSELAAILGRSRRAFVGIALLSTALNVILLGGSIYMMLVYDLVLPSRSVPTLLELFVMIMVVYVFQALLELIRSGLLRHVAATLDVDLGERIHRMIGQIARTRPGQDSLQPMRDLDQVRTFLSGGGPTALIDLPWMFFFIAVLFILHPLIGLTVLLGGFVLIGLTILTDRLSAEPTARLTALASARHMVADGSRRHAEALRALGMEARVGQTWTRVSGQYLAAQERMASVAGTLGGINKVFRMLLQSLVLTVGAMLVMRGQASGGVIFASSILSSRALAPVELAIANWRGFVSARQSWARLRGHLSTLPGGDKAEMLPPPRNRLTVENLSLAPPGSERLTVRNASFRVMAGEAVAVIGPSGCGKSTLIRGLIGVLPPAAGSVRLDGASLDQWPSDTLGRHIGYLPQNVELLSGTVAENIARFEPDASSEDIVAAARLAGVHDLILHLPEGYNTPVGVDGASLSGGQRQRLALARALYGDPFLIILDEPNSNLDQTGEQALAEAVRASCARGAIVILVAHRPSILAAVDLVVLMRDGQVIGFDRKEALVPDLLPPADAPAPLMATGGNRTY